MHNKLLKLTIVNQHGMAVLKGSKICIGMLNMRSPGSIKHMKKLDFMAYLEVKKIYLMKSEMNHNSTGSEKCQHFALEFET